MIFDENTPYLSVIVVSRNDDHGSGMFRRTESCLNNIIYQLEKHKVPSELLLVEWSPSATRPLLKDEYCWPKDNKCCRVNVLEVPPRVAGNDDETDDYCIRDLTPWNVGIRRAAGQFVLSTVADVLFSDELVAYIAEQRLDNNCIYRIDRYDVDRNILNIKDSEHQIEFAQSNVIDIHKLNPLKFIFKRKLPILHDKAPGDFILMSKSLWHSLHGFPEGLNCGADTLLLYMAYLSGARHEILNKPLRMYHIDHDSRWKSPSYIKFRRLLFRMKLPTEVIDVISKIGADLLPSKSALDRRGVSLVSSRDIKFMIEEIIEGKRSPIYNGDVWGLGHTDLTKDKVA